MKVRQTTTCHTCRARKLGCDGKVPACTQCLFSGRQCAGYQQDLVIIQHQPPSVRRSICKYARDSPGRATPNTVLEAMPPTVPVRTMPLEAYSALIIGKYAPWLVTSSEYSNLATPPFRICGSWVGVLPELLSEGGSGRVLSSAVTALGLAIRCEDTPHGPATSSCVRAHGIALSLLRNKLMKMKESIGVHMVAAGMCLSLAETLLPICKEGWKTHFMGVGKFVQLSGPSKYTLGVSHQLFTGLRPLIIFEAFQSRKSSFLALEEWQTIPFLAYPATPTQALLNLAAPIPTLLERFDTLMKSPQITDVLGAFEIWLQFNEVLLLLDQWEQSYRLGIQDPPYWPRFSEKGSHHFPGNDSRESFWFPNVFVGTAFTQLWSLRIICIEHRAQLESQFADLSSRRLSAETEFRNQPNKQRVSMLSIWICKSMEYLMQDDGILYGPISTLFPLKVVYKIFKSDLSRNREKIDWCERIVDRLVYKGVDLSSLL